MRARRQRLRLGLLAATGLVAAAIGVLAWATDALQSLEVRTIDARFSVRGEEKPADVAVVGMDEQTLEDLELRPPLPRSLHARVMDRLRRDGAKVIAYDLEFTEPTEVDEDNALFDATARAGNVVLATSRIGPRGQTDVFGGPEGLRTARATVGSTNLDTISGRVYRFFHDENGVPTFPVAAAQRATGRPVSRSHFDDDDQAWIDFAGPPGTIETVSFSRVLDGRFPRGTFRDKVVVVGSTALILQDIQSTATGEMPGPEINANAIATILEDFPLDVAPGWLAVVLIALLGLAAPVAAVPLHGLRWLVPALLVLAVYVVAVQLAFDGGSILPLVPALLAFFLGLLSTLGVTYATELRDRRRLRAQFARFVPASVVDEVVARAEDEDLRLGGVRREGTVLFSDLRGFTTAAEAMAAEQVIEVLNRYLTEMSEAILDHGGTVVSYMGDGIMAVFGAPLEQEDHRDRAVAAAREMAFARLDRFNVWVREAGIGDGFRMGIGICSGPVMSGNVGSQRRLEYTAVGDTTNMASRLEAMTKEAGHPVLIAETTAARLAGGAEDGLNYVGELSVRGRTGTVKVWTLAGSAGG